MSIKKILLGVGVAILIFVLALVIAIAYLLNNYQNTKIRAQEPATELSQFHSKNGYTITYPKNWTVDNSEISAPAEFIREPNGKAFFSMQTLFDPRIIKPAEMPKVHQDIEQSYKNDSNYLVEWSEWEKDDITTAENSYFVAGQYAEDGKNWRFKEITIFTKSGIALILRGATLKDYSNDFGAILDKIIFSVQPNDEKDTAGSQAQALFKVKSRPEVVKFEADLEKAGKKASFEVQRDDGGEDWMIQVFEIVKNNDEPSHTATFGWYRVNKKTGEVNPDL